MLKKLLLTIGMCVLPLAAHAADINVHWDPNTESDLSGYTIHYGTESGVYTTVVPVGNVLTHTLSLNAGTYYLVVSASDTSGNESDDSYEIKLTVKVSTPTGVVVE